MLIGTIPSAFVIQPRLRSDAVLPTGGVRFSTLVPALEDVSGDVEFEVVGLRDAMIIPQQVGCEFAGGFWEPRDVVAQFLIAALAGPAQGLHHPTVSFSGTQAHDRQSP